MPDTSFPTDGRADDDRFAPLLDICRVCVEALDMSGGGISVVTSRGNRGVVCSTDAVAGQIEAQQLTLGEGPCVDAVKQGGPIMVSDLGATDFLSARWPAFLKSAQAAGVQALFALPLNIGGIGVGVMDLYRNQPGDLDSRQLGVALKAADAAAVALLHVDFGGESGSLTPAPWPLGDAVVHQATGMVKEQLDVSLEEAFLRLRARAFVEDRPAAEVAREVVERRIRFDMEEEE